MDENAILDIAVACLEEIATVVSKEDRSTTGTAIEIYAVVLFI